MIRAIIEQTFDQQKKYVILAGKSTDSKPTTGIITGSKFEEVDTGIVYAFDEVSGTWSAVGLSPAEIKAEIDAWLDEHPEATTTVEDGAISYAKLDSSLQGSVDDVADLKTEMQTKANIDGYYEQMTVGNAEQLVSTVGVEDKVPYLFRTSGGSADIGDREVDEIIGGTIAWNQFAAALNSNWIKSNNSMSASYADGVATITYTSQYQYIYRATKIIPIGHKVLLSFDVNRTAGTGYVRAVYCANLTPSNITAIANSTESDNNKGWVNCGTVANVSVMDSYMCIALQDCRTEQGEVKFRNVQFFDLTQMFGSTIADYIYTLEQNTAGSGVAFFRNLFPKPYYAYDAGTLMSVCTNAHRTVGFNAWDEVWELGRIDYDKTSANWGQNVSTNNQIRSKNYIPVVPNTVYHCTCATGATIYAIFYDINKNPVLYNNSGYGSIGNANFTIPADAHFIRFYVQGATTYSNDICINLHWDGERDGEYEPYVVHTYALDDVELRGIPKLDANNKLFYDGDSYESDGTVTRKYAYVVINGSNDYIYQPNGVANNASLCYIKFNDKAYGESNFASNRFVVANESLRGPFTARGRVSAVGIEFALPSDVEQNATALKAWFTNNPTAVLYELATPTTETADPYNNPQIVSDWGTEEYVDALATAQTSPRDVAIPVGHDTTYQNNLRAKLEMSPESPSGDGDYIVRQTNGENVYVQLTFPADELPAAPTTDGTYRLVCTVADGTTTFTWEAIE